MTLPIWILPLLAHSVCWWTAAQVKPSGGHFGDPLGGLAVLVFGIAGPVIAWVIYGAFILGRVV